MERMDRRTALKLTGTLGAATLAGGCTAAYGQDAGDTRAVLVDLTQCVGCRYCEEVCAEANGLPPPEVDEDTANATYRTTNERQYQVVNRHETSRGEVFVRRQCMHCVQPACTAACLTKALYKTPEGPVIWREDKCMGCRYCMVSCPFDVPKFEYDSAVPRIQKCKLCFERLEEGEKPACVENCPAEALTFGSRDEMLELAKERVYGNPDQYARHVYGEHEAGGTSWFYISPVPFEELDLPTDLEDAAYPEMTRDFLTAVPVVLTLWPAFLLGLRRATAHDEADDGEEV